MRPVGPAFCRVEYAVDPQAQHAILSAALQPVPGAVVDVKSRSDDQLAGATRHRALGMCADQLEFPPAAGLILRPFCMMFGSLPRRAWASFTLTAAPNQKGLGGGELSVVGNLDQRTPTADTRKFRCLSGVPVDLAEVATVRGVDRPVVAVAGHVPDVVPALRDSLRSKVNRNSVVTLPARANSVDLSPPLVMVATPGSAARPPHSNSPVALAATASAIRGQARTMNDPSCGSRLPEVPVASRYMRGRSMLSRRRLEPHERRVDVTGRQA